jgi:UDP-2,3-diacylglucosamine pyrophosphatase LpxH
VNEGEISEEESCSPHNFLKYTGIANSFNNVYSYQGTRYIVKEGKYNEFDQKLFQETSKIFNYINFRGGVEELDMNLSTIASKEKDLEMFVDTFIEALQTACWKTFKTICTENNTKKKKSVPWWTDSLTIMRKRINALRRIYQRTRSNQELKESRKYKYLEEKKKYQYEIRKEKFNSWKVYCNVTTSSDPWSQVYKLAIGKV